MRSIDVERVDGVPVARVSGDIDATNAAGLRDELSECLRGEADELVLDLGEVGYVDSAGIDMLFRLHDLLVQRRAILRVVIARGTQLDRLSEIVGLRAAVAVYGSGQEALEAGAA